MDEADEGRRGDDLQIEPEGPVLDVVKIHANAQAHLLGVLGRPPQALDLRPSRHARLDAVAAGIAVEPVAVVVIVGERMRSRPNQRHLATQDVEQLWQLVYAGAVPGLADAGCAP